MRPVNRRQAAFGLAAVVVVASASVRAHGQRVGSIIIDHPYALPSLPGADTGFAHLRALRNRGEPDRLIGVSTPVARAAVLESVEAGGRAEAVPALPLPPQSEIALRHDGRYRIALRGLTRPLRDGDRFELTLHFERAGPVIVQTWVQAPRATSRRASDAHSH